MKRLTSIIVAAVLTATSGCAVSADRKSGDSLTYVSYGGAFQDGQIKAWQEPFSQQEGTQFKNTSPSDPSQIRAMVDAGKTVWDVVDTNPFFPAQYCGTYVEKLDLSTIDKSKFPPDTVSECAVPAERFALLFVYNADVFGSNPPTKMADFFDTKKFPGRRALTQETSTGLLETALVADGVAPDKLYPLDLDRALRQYDKIRSQTTFAANNGALQQLIVDKQASMALIVSARALTALRGGANIKPVWDQTITTFNTLSIPKGSPNKELAQKFIAFATSPEQSAKFSELSGTSPANLDAKPTMDAAATELNAFDPSRVDKTYQINAVWWSQNFTASQNKFVNWLAS